MHDRPVAAGKSSFGHIDPDLAFSRIILDRPAVYLDLACGAGNYALALAERVGPESEVHGLDLWAEGVAALTAEAAKRGLANVRARQADVTGPLPLADGGVDVCFMATALHDLPPETRGRVMGEIRRVLAPRGALVIIEFKKQDSGPGPRKEQRLGEADVKALALPHGFVADGSLSLGEFTYLIRFQALA